MGVVSVIMNMPLSARDMESLKDGLIIRRKKRGKSCAMTFTVSKTQPDSTPHQLGGDITFGRLPLHPSTIVKSVPRTASVHRYMIKINKYNIDRSLNTNQF